MATTPPPNPLKHVRASDVRGAAQLAVKATSQITGVVEGVHRSVLNTMGLSSGGEPGKTGGVTGLIYKSIQGVTGLVGKGLDKALEKLIPVLEAGATPPAESAERDVAIAVLNGVMGDRLVDDGNPLAIGMQLRWEGQVMNWDAMPNMPGANDRVMLFVHGLCMTDSQWLGASADGRQVDLSVEVARKLGYTPVFLRYNTGLHISLNGRELSRQLELLVQHWPVALHEISIVAHSMGGLLSRSAVQVAPQHSATWPKLLKNLVFLGTPHHGAPLERAGNWVDAILGSTPYTAPYAKLAQLRSAGITDLRYGHVSDGHWVGKDRFRKSPHTREPLPLPEGVACYTVAATTAESRTALADHVLGDGLVPLNSALGHHREARHRLVFAKDSQWIIYGTGHIALMKSPAVAEQLLHWLTPASPPS